MGFVLAIGLLAGCSRSSAAPNLSPVRSTPASSSASGSGSASTSPSVSAAYPADVPLTGHNVKPGEKPPGYPAAAHAHTQQGANAFAEFFLRTLDWAYATTNPSYMKHYYGPTCGLCSGIATGIAKTAAEHHWYEGGRLKIRPPVATSIGPVTAPADFCSAEIVDEATFSTVDARGKVYTGDGPHTGDHIKLCMTARSTSWFVTYMAGT